MRRTYGLDHVLIAVHPAAPQWQQAIELARGLAEHGVRSTIAAMSRPAKDQKAEACNVPGLDLRTADSDGTAEWLLFLEGRVQPDLLHVFDPAWIGAPFRSPVVLSYFRHESKELSSAGSADLLRAADLVIVPTGVALRELERLPGAALNAVAIYPGITRGPQILSRDKQMAVAYADSASLPMLEVAARGQSWPVYSFGDFHAPEGANLFPIGSDVSTRLRAWASRSPVFVYTDVRQAFPMCVLEAAHAGCALLLVDTPATRELWDRAALFFSLDDPETLRTALSQAIEDEGLRTYLRMRARERAASYDSRSMVRNVLFAYQETLQGVADPSLIGSNRAEML